MTDYALFVTFIFLWFLVLYHHFLFPLLLRSLQKRLNSSEVNHSEKEDTFRNICILVPAYNEAEVIADKIRNVASLNYPEDKLSLVIACDGCKDNTAAIARKTALEPESACLDIRVINFKHNHGKVALLNVLIPSIDSEIIALSDASALISNDALLIANQHFQDDQTGVVAATYKLLNPGSEGEKKYWEYQVNNKRGEAAIGSPIGVHGALYFIRADLFKHLPPDTINDDFIIPMQIVCQGYKSIYESRLIALELEQASLSMDQNRRLRIAAGNLQQLLRLPELMSLKHRGTAFSFISGKALRTLMPFLLLGQLLISLYLATSSDFFALITLFQILMIAMARLSLHAPESIANSNPLWKPARLAFYLINGYYSSFIGSVRYIIGLHDGPWKSISKS